MIKANPSKQNSVKTRFRKNHTVWKASQVCFVSRFNQSDMQSELKKEPGFLPVLPCTKFVYLRGKSSLIRLRKVSPTRLYGSCWHQVRTVLLVEVAAVGRSCSLRSLALNVDRKRWKRFISDMLGTSEMGKQNSPTRLISPVLPT